MKRHERMSQAQGCAPPPQVAEASAKTTLFAEATLGRAWVRHIVSHGLAREGQPRNM